jgi:hypothetical protein
MQSPSHTLCINSDDGLAEISEGKIEKFGKSIYCSVMNVKKDFECSLQTQEVESVTPFSHRCLTYFSQLLDSKESLSGHLTPNFIIQGKVKIFALIHQNGTPPHLFRNKIRLMENSRNQVDYSTTYEKLLTFPYATDCKEYKKFDVLSNSYRSKEDCIIKNLERKELEQCGCNKRWSYWAHSVDSNRKVCKKEYNCTLDLLKELDLLRNYCKNNCLNEYFTDVTLNSIYLTESEQTNVMVYIPFKYPRNEIIFNHLPKMIFTEYLCSIGGLASMWFGICLFDLTLDSMRKNKYIINFILGIIELKGKYQFQPISITFNLSKLYTISRRIILTIYTGIMMQQIIILIINYSTFETVTRFDVEKIKYLPMILIDKKINMSNLDKLIKIYPEMEQDINLIKNQSLKIGLDEDDESKWLRANYDKYLLKLLSDNKLNEIHEIAETNRIMKLCYFEFEFKTINCSKIEAGISIGKPYFSVISLLNYSKYDFEPEFDMNKLRRIMIKYHEFENFQLVMMLFKYHSVFIPRFPLSPEMNARTKLIYSAYTIKKIDSPRHKCISNEKVDHFGEEYFDFCKIDCIARLVNQTFGCLTIRNKYLLRYFKRDLVNNYY